ncbi:helix-turn-helix domain-containing protein [Schleiferilactobacillus shenzhenensis]|nr:helix-turn-helix domain-containing protein [Schleiferilactobacillus shenzhenensis]
MATNGFVVTPDYATAPGETIKETLDALSMTQDDLAQRLGITPKSVSKLINGKAPLTPRIAAQLELIFHVPAPFWNSLEKQYREFLERQEQKKVLNEKLDYTKHFPYSEMVKAGMVPEEREKSKRLENLLKFFRFADFSAFEEVMESDPLSEGAYRIDVKHYSVNQYALHAWIQQGTIEAEEIDTAPFDRRRLVDSVTRLRALTRETRPSVFIPELQHIAADFGVAVVLVPELKGSRVSGLTRWLSPYPKAIIELSLRYKTNDVLWFTLFHELAHLVLHSKKMFYTLKKAEYLDSKEEREADQWAANKLIPEPDWKRFVEVGSFGRSQILAFAQKVGIHEGIVVGRLQRAGLLPYSVCSDLKVHYRWQNDD